MINSVVLVGRAVGEPKVKTFDSGKMKAEVTMAINRPTKDKESDFFDIEIWGKSAEVAKEYLKKGHLFGVESGRLEQQRWTTKDGEKRSKLVVTTNNIRLMQPKSDGDSDKQPAKQEENLDDIFASEDEFPY